MDSKKVGIVRFVGGAIFLALIICCVYQQSKLNENEVQLSQQQNHLVEYDASVIEVLSGFIDYKTRLDTIPDSTNDTLQDIKRIHIWGWRSTSNLLWSRLDSLRVEYGLRDTVEVID